MDSLYLIVKYFKNSNKLKSLNKKLPTFYLKLEVDTIYIKLFKDERN
jgi:hypothetical protein